MERIIKTLGLLLLISSTSYASVEGLSDQEWADIGDVSVSVEGDAQVQRAYDDINDKEGLFEVGSFIRLAQDINLRTSPEGQKIKPVLKGTDFQVLGATLNKGKRYYKVKDGVQIGYIYAGTKASYNKWAKEIWMTENKVIAQAGDQIKIKRKRGAKLSSKMDNNHFYSIPRGAEVRVQSVSQAKDGKIFYKVKYKARSGFVEFGSDQKVLASTKWSEIK